MTTQEQLELLYEKLRAYKQMTVEAREFFKEEIAALVAKIKVLEA